MVPFLESMGVGPVPPPKDGNLASVPEICGAVISLSVNSANGDTPEGVLATVHKKWPSMPIMVATLMTFDVTKRTMERTFRMVNDRAELVPVSEETAKRSDLGQPHVLLVVTKGDLADLNQRNLLGQIVSRHLCG
jgi:hypothetical protein